MFVLLPLAIVIYFAFTREGAAGATEFSIDGFLRLFDPMYLGVILKSFKVAIISTLVCILCGYPAAYILARSRSRAKFIIVILMLLPMWMNFLLRTYSWLSILENTGIVNTVLSAMGFSKVRFLYNEGAVVLGTVYNYLPFMIMPIYITLLKLDESHLEAAADLGANPVQAFLRVTLPFSVPGILSGISMVFVPSVTTFVISQLMGGGKVPLIGDVIEQQFRVVNDWHFGSALSVVIMVIVLIFMHFINRGDVEAGTGNGGRLLR
ncbi:MAG: ABC transporter permease [Oscillospiraceae bacterium]|nr:ABC transporter permease [Oscillospiraceae bacterium]